MLHTVFSNSYEVLREALLINVRSDNEGRQNPVSLFKATEVVVPSEAVADALRRFMADRYGICAGVAFKSIGSWFIKFGRPLIGMGEAGSELEFLIWRILTTPEFAARFDRLAFYLKDKTPTERYGFAMHVAAVFSRYSTYRLDWVLQWMGVKAETDFPADDRTAREKATLQAHPDYAWQRALWQELRRSLSEEHAAEDLRNLARIEDKMTKAGEANRGETVHIFMPFALPPLILPMLKKMAEGELADEADVYLYLLNPSQEYWYESVPRGAGDWKTEGESEAVLAYLRRNAASTRAVIERVYAFLNTESAVPLIGVEPEDTPDGKANVSAVTTTGAFDPVVQRLQALQLVTEQDTESYFVEPGNTTLLRCLQSAFLTLDESAANDADLTDGSVTVCAAPGRLREVENLVDWMQSVLAAGDVRPEDILVVTPDIDASAGVIEAVMSAQPAERRIAWTVLSPASRAEALAVASWEKLVKFLFSRAEMSAFEAWLELPLVLKRWSMTASDLAVIHTWLTAGGYRFGLSDEHVAALAAKNPSEDTDTDGTLMKAVERLTLAFFYDDAVPAVFGDLTAADGAGWQDGVVENAALFERFVVLAEALEEKRQVLAGMGDDVPPDKIRSFLSSLAAEFLDFSDVPQAKMAIETSLTAVTEALERTLGRNAKVAPGVFAKSACAHVAETASHRTPSGVTFAGMAAFRGLPFKAVAILGLDRGSAFPGLNRTEEFDLMAAGRENGVTARRGDRDSRMDNRNIFFDLLLAAREKFFVSYSEGYEKGQTMPPSVVVDDFLAFVTAVTGDDRAAEKLTVKVPMTVMSRRNFAGTAEGGRPWLSTDAMLLSAVNAAQKAGFSEAELVFAEGASVLLENETTVGADILVKYFNDPDRFVLRRMGITSEDDEADGASVGATLAAADDPLTKSLRQRRTAEMALTGVPKEAVTAAAAKDPVNGAPGIRETVLNEEIDRVYDAAALFKNWQPAGDIASVVVPVKDLTRVKEIRFPAMRLYRAEGKDTPFAAFMTFSNSERRRLRLMQCLRNALLPAEHLEMRFVAADDKTETLTAEAPVMGDEEAQTATDVWLRLFDALAVAADVVPSPADAQTGTLRAPGRLLWRGENERAMSDDAQAFQEAYRTFLELPSEDDELSAWAAKKAKALETMVNAAGVLLAAVR